MQINQRRWSNLLRFCGGLTLGAAFCMKWIEPGLISEGKVFTILGLELTYDTATLNAIFTHIDPRVSTLLSNNLYFDFAFMAGIYPSIAALCMLAAGKRDTGILRSLLILLAVLQVLAWGCDIFENYSLLHWLKNREAGELGIYHVIVWTKWILALSGVLLALPVYFLSRRQK